MSDFEIVHGKAAGLSFGSSVHGSEDHISTSHLLTFEVGGRPVSLTCDELPYIRDGDTIFLVGKTKGGLFRATSYRNIDRNIIVKGQMGAFRRFLFCYVFSFIPPVCIGGWYFWYRDNLERKKDKILQTYQKYI